MIITLEDMSAVATQLLQRGSRIYTFTGSLGAGKTTLTQHMLRQLGVTDIIQSPTYTYICQYRTQDGRAIIHFDLYRLRSEDDFIQAGFDEYLYDEKIICFIEWPEIIMPLLQEQKDVTHVALEYLSDKARIISIK